MRVLTRSRLRELLAYDPATGAFTRAVRASQMPAGSKAGCLSKRGYWCIRVDGHPYTAHRLAWLYMTGEWPAHEVDHINRDRTDNRWANLRHVTHAQNLQNIGAPRNNKSGHTGVHWHRERRKWLANIMVAQRTIHLGRFDRIEDAIAARKEGERRYHPHKQQGAA